MAIVEFYLNDRPMRLTDPDPGLLLIDFLRSADVGLAGPKKPCGQGGCGSCTVILSRMQGEEEVHRAINSCLRPVCSLHGLAITTIEGTTPGEPPESNPPITAARHLLHSRPGTRGAPSSSNTPPPPSFLRAAETARDLRSAEASPAIPVNEAAYALAVRGGSQCGYCSVGFVMNMSEYLYNDRPRLKQSIEQAFDGNLCRCTGYRSILAGMKSFATDLDPEDRDELTCELDPETASFRPVAPVVRFPGQAREPRRPITVERAGRRWLTVETPAELARVFAASQPGAIRLVQANTSYGIYPDEVQAAQTLVDISMIDLNDQGIEPPADQLSFAGDTTYSDLLDDLEGVGPLEGSARAALAYMARRTAGRIVRNAATIGGNVGLMLGHIAAGEPFPSDLSTALVGVAATVSYLVFEPGQPAVGTVSSSLTALVEACRADASLPGRIVIVQLSVPSSPVGQVVLAQKAALREVNSHSIVNCTTALTIDGTQRITDVRVVLGGIAPYPWRPTALEQTMIGQQLDVANLEQWCQVIEGAVLAERRSQAERWRDLPSEGITDAYRAQLACGFLFRAVINARTVRQLPVPAELRSAGEVRWGTWPTSSGSQRWDNASPYAPVARPYIKTTALAQAAGRIRYTQEQRRPEGCLEAAFVQSQRALARFHFTDPSSGGEPISLANLHGHLARVFGDRFVRLVTAADVPAAGLNQQGMGLDQPMFATDDVRYVGQSLALVLAADPQDAEAIAAYVGARCVVYTAPDVLIWRPPWDKPVLGLPDAIGRGSIFPDAPASAPFNTHIWQLARPQSDLSWVDTARGDLAESITVTPEVAIGPANGTRVATSQLVGGQAHFYMETQSCLAVPEDQGRLTVYVSTQSPAAMHETIAMILGVPYNHITVRVPPVGGGFGGKTEQTRFTTGPVALAAQLTGRPVRLALTRDADSAMIGKRHGYFGQVQVLVDAGQQDPSQRGVLRGLSASLWGDGGAFYDCSYVVSNCIQTRTDNAYMIDNFRTQIDVCRTNTAPSTAMRAFGDVQGTNIIENAIEDAAIAIGMRPDELREKNFYTIGDVTPFGQPLEGAYIDSVWRYLKRQCEFDGKLAAVEAFNEQNRWVKRGISIIPVKYGSGYNWVQLEQSTALVVINQSDGTVTIHQAGVEIGQGLATQVVQVAAHVLGLPLDHIRIENPQTNVIPNPTSTGASTGTPYSCEAVKQTCEDMRQRLIGVVEAAREAHGDDWCVQEGLNYWSYGGDWSTTVKANGRCAMIWQFIVQYAFSQRVSMIAEFNAKIKGGEIDMANLTFKPRADQPVLPGITPGPSSTEVTGSSQQFVGFTYSAACSVVEVDILTGETKLLSSDVMYDMGKSMNPAIDIGQVEGAFIQGVGMLTSETLTLQSDGEHAGRLNATNTWRYKIPATASIPLQLNVSLFPRHEAGFGGKDIDTGVYSAKEVGEPPLVLANSVFFAIKDAVRASRRQRGLNELFRLDAPATPQEVSRACNVQSRDIR